ncbi:MAG: diguanylate cyclase [Bryobacterales bacterium]|nr:diguanylate cyclase [Bryobacterales bacterium]
MSSVSIFRQVSSSGSVPPMRLDVGEQAQQGEQGTAEKPKPQAARLPWVARLYLTAMVALAVVCFLDAIQRAEPVNPGRFVLYLGISVAASVLKVRLPGIRGTMSVNFLFLLTALVALTVTETLVIGLVSALAQTFWRPKSRPSLERTAFNVALIAIALRATYSAFHVEQLGPIPIQFHLRLIVTAGVYFLMNTVPVAIMITLTEHKPLVKTWRETYLWVFSYYLVGAAFAGVFSALEKAMGWEAATLVLPVIYTVYRAYRLYLSQVEAEKAQAELQRAHAEAQRIHAEEVSALHLRTIEALAMAIEAKDQTTHDHLQRVQIYCTELGKLMNLSEDEMLALRAASLLHDIGKLAVPEHIISKPGKLTPEEFEKMKIHPVVGAEILEHVQFPYPVVPIVRHHHERWDGTGYPDGVKGTEIPIGARILSAVDCLDALASDRQYRPALPLDEAMAEVERFSGSRYDPEVVRLLQDNYQRWEREARGNVPARNKLNTDIRVERGDAPAAGFATAEGAAARRKNSAEFLNSIGAARHEAQAIFELTQDMGRTLALNEMLPVFADRLKKLIPHDAIAVYLLEKSQEALIPAFVGGENSRLFASLRIPMGQGLSGWVAENRKTIVNGNPSVEPGYLNDRSKFTLMRAALCIPLEEEGKLLGTLALYSAEKEGFTQDHLRIVQLLSGKLAQSVQNAISYQRAEDTSLRDHLTGLPNSRALAHHVEELLRAGRMVTVMVGDLDGFKEINDTYGHPEGDRLLRAAAAALRDSCRHQDFAARMGGDEFVLVCADLDPQDAQETMERAVSAVEQAATELYGKPVVSLSAGLASSPDDGLNHDQLIAVADRRMYETKAARKAERRRTASLLAVNAAVLASHRPEAVTGPGTRPA